MTAGRPPTAAERYVEEVHALVRRMPSGIRCTMSAEDEFDVSVQRIVVEEAERRRGLASALMREAAKLADRMGVTLFLEALPEEDEDGEPAVPLRALAEFYERFGFEGGDDGDEAEAGSVMMFRRTRRDAAP